jgi:hypothetical protein
MSNKMWDVLVEHAKTCVLSGKLYIYYPEDEKNVGVVFNNIYELSGLIANGQYYSADSLSDNQKVRNLGLLISQFHIVGFLVASPMHLNEIWFSFHLKTRKKKRTKMTTKKYVNGLVLAGLC